MKNPITPIAILAVLAVGNSTFAATVKEGWSFGVTPYAWLAGLEGDLSVAGNKVDFDKSFSDLFDSVELAASLRLSAEYNRYLIGASIDYFSLSTDDITVSGAPQGGVLDTKMTLTELALGYRFDGWAEGQSIDVMAGVRNLHVNNDLRVNGVGDFSRDNDVTDAMIYVLPDFPMFPSKIDGLSFNLLLGIGAGDSEFVYEIFPQFLYQFTDIFLVSLGYRAVGWDYEGDSSDNELNLTMAGLTIGFGARF